LIEHDYSTITYDWRNLMTGYGSTWTYTYDAFGERVRKYEGSYRYYLTSGMNILEEYNNSQSVDAVHIYNGNMQLATLIPGNDIYYVCADQIMSSKALVDESGNIDQTRHYYPYGAIRTGTGNISDYQYSGKELDRTGFYYFGARYYDPNFKRWLSCDPAEQGWSPYVYCGGNPVNMVDPDGEFVIEALVIAYRLYQIYSYANMAYQMYDAYQHGGFNAMMTAGMQMGASYVIGSAVGGVVNFGSGPIGTMLSGGLSGAITGGTVSAMFGGNFKDGAISGGIGGALSAGIGYYGNKALAANAAEDNLGDIGGPQKHVQGTDLGTDKSPEGLSNPEFDLNNLYDNADAEIISNYGNRTLNGVQEWHNSIDARATSDNKYGTNVNSISSGEVVSMRSNGTYMGKGNFVNIQTKVKGLSITYYHVTPSSTISKGANVNVGTNIGVQSKTGRIFGPHTHMITYFNGIRFNPTFILKK